MKVEWGVMVEMLYNLLQGQGHALLEDLQIKDAYTYTYLRTRHEFTTWTKLSKWWRLYEKIHGMGATIQITRIIINIKSHSMVITIHIVETCVHSWTTYNSMQPESFRQDSGSCATSRPDQSMNSNMWMNVLKSNMIENHLIISQWCGPLTGTRETTNNDNGSQGATI